MHEAATATAAVAAVNNITDSASKCKETLYVDRASRSFVRQVYGDAVLYRKIQGKTASGPK